MDSLIKNSIIIPISKASIPRAQIFIIPISKASILHAQIFGYRLVRKVKSNKYSPYEKSRLIA